MDQKQSMDNRSERTPVEASKGFNDQAHGDPPPSYTQVQNSIWMGVPDPRQNQGSRSPVQLPQPYYPPQPYQYPPQVTQYRPQINQFPQQVSQFQPQKNEDPPQRYQYPLHGFQNPHQGYQNPPQGYQYPPQPYHTQQPSRTLHVYSESWKGNSIRVLDTDKTTLLYSMKIQMRKPHIAIESASPGTPVGTVVYHYLTARIDITVYNSSISLTSKGILKNGHTYSSPALGGQTLTWKLESWNLNIVCVDQSERPIAKIEFSNWSVKKCGKLELLGPSVQNGPVMDEIVVTGLAFAEYVAAQRNPATAGVSWG